MSRTFQKLNRDKVKALTPGQIITEAGIIVERTADGDLRWSVNVMISGRRVHRVVGREADGVTRSECEAYIEQVRTDERHERLNLPSRRKTHLTFEQVARRYLDRMERGGGRNLKSKKQHLNRWLIPYFSAQRADAITEFTVNRYKRGRIEQGAAAGTVNRELATLKHLFRDAAKAKDIKASPCSFGLLDEPPGRMTILSDAEGEALVAGAIGDQDPDVWLFVAFGLNTAMRHREILQARFDQVDWARHRLHIPTAKAGAREQPLTAALVALLRKERDARTDKAGFIFLPRNATAKKAHRSSLAKPFARAVERAGLDPSRVTPHTMRHTAITRLVQAGVDLPTIQQISGHKTLAMVLRYAHVSGAHIDAAMKTLDRTIPEPTPPEQNATGTLVTPKLHTA